MNYELNVKLETEINVDNFGFFDHKEGQKKKSELGLKKSGLLIRDKDSHQISFLKSHQIEEKYHKHNSEPLFYLTEQDSTYKITDIKDHGHPLLMLAGQSSGPQNQKLPLKQGSSIRIGRVWMELLKIKADLRQGKTFYEESQRSLKIQGVSRIVKQSYSFKVEDNEESSKMSQIEDIPFCRFCFSKRFQNDNELLLLCKCEGSVKYIHEQCLGNWTLSRIGKNQVQKNNTFVLPLKVFQCQICKQWYPFQSILEVLMKKAQEDEKLYSLRNLDEYLIFLVHYEQKPQVWIVNLDETQNISIGRESENQIIIHDASVSRQHCIISYNRKKRELLLSDNSSKFGTSLKKPSIIVRDTIRLQKGPTVMTIRREEKKSLINKLFMCST